MGLASVIQLCREKGGLLATLVIPGVVPCKPSNQPFGLFLFVVSAFMKASFQQSLLQIKTPADAGVGLRVCGERGIRTPGPSKRTTVFKTAAFDHSAISPLQK